jgi:hypothetical protein
VARAFAKLRFKRAQFGRSSEKTRRDRAAGTLERAIEALDEAQRIIAVRFLPRRSRLPWSGANTCAVKDRAFRALLCRFADGATPVRMQPVDLHLTRTLRQRLAASTHWQL